MFCRAFPETGLWEHLPRKGSDVFQKAALGEVGSEVRGDGWWAGRLRGNVGADRAVPGPPQGESLLQLSASTLHS